MPRLPTVAIIGRPNTGKSTLFNRLVGKRIAIVSNVPGTTRDHIASVVETADVDYLLVDTGGMGGGTEDAAFEKNVHGQSLLAITHADVIVFTINSREELTGSDRDVVQLLRKKRRRHVPVILVVTKCDDPSLTEQILPQYHALGIADEILPVSALNNVGVVDAEEAIVRELQKLHFGKRERIGAEERLRAPRIAVIGKPNVGKSSFVNALMSDTQREESPRLVSDIPGTTRDATNTIIQHEGKPFVFVDTAGLRRQARVEEDLEHYSILRTIQALQECDIALLVLDATEPTAKQDKRIAGMVVEAGKGLVLILNKMDLLTAEKKKEKQEEVREMFLFCRYAPLVPCSAKTRDGLLKVFPLLEMVQRNRERRIPVKELHTWLGNAVYGQPMGALSTCKHIVQAEDPPPTFVLFVRNPKTVQLSQLRYLDNRIREMFGFEGAPIRWITKGGRSEREYNSKKRRDGRK